MYWVLKGGRIYSYSFYFQIINQSCALTDVSTRDTWHVTEQRGPESGNPGGEENVTQPGISQFGQVISVPDIWVLTSDEAMLKMLSITHWSETNLATRTN